MFLKRKIILNKLLKSNNQEEIEFILISAEEEMYSVFNDFISLGSLLTLPAPFNNLGFLQGIRGIAT
jgi:hypothetical protein